MPQPIKSLFELLINSYNTYRSLPAFIYRAGEEQISVTYEKFLEDVLLLTRAFQHKGLKKGQKVLLLSDNRYSWVVTDMALMAIGAISVPRGSDTPSQELEFIINHSECEHLIFETEILYSRHEPLAKKLKKIKNIFIIAGEEKHSRFAKVHNYYELLEDRSIAPEDIQIFISLGDHINEDDIVTLIYTSGTTGTPKGVILTHRNLCHNIRNLPQLITLSRQDRWLSILPSWHIFERTAEYIALAKGSTIVYSTIRTFAADLEQFKPTLVATVPRLWESMYAKVNAALKKQNPKKAKLFQILVKISASWKYNYRILRGRIPRFKKENIFILSWKKLVATLKLLGLLPLYLIATKKLLAVQAKFGGRLRMAISGGGSLPQYLDEWIDAIGIRIVNAYGMTECSPGIAGRGIRSRVFGTLGPPVPETELRIIGENGQPLLPGQEGEIQVRGEQVTPGYYKNEEENEKAFTADGFFKTGDLGKFTISGELIITGRAKEIIVLANGENVDPSRIEATITMFPFVADAVLVGQDKKGLGALIVPDMEKLKEYATEKFEHLVHETENFMENQELMNKVKSEINKLLNSKKGFKPYEKLQNITFLEKEFKLGEELTNTLKKKRHVIEKKYKEVINKLLN